MDLNDVKAGKYQLVAVRWDQITSKPGEPLDYVRYRRGDIVDLNAEDAKRLVAAGAVVKPGQLEKTKAEAARALAERAAQEYQAILAGLPEDVRSEVAPETVSQTATDPKPGSVEFILAEVGDDGAKAATALEAETGEGGKNRSGLVKKLQAVIDAGQGSAGQSGGGQSGGGQGGGGSTGGDA
jgi:uncharacterized membrane protein YgcG